MKMKLKTRFDLACARETPLSRQIQLSAEVQDYGLGISVTPPTGRLPLCHKPPAGKHGHAGRVGAPDCPTNCALIEQLNTSRIQTGQQANSQATKQLPTGNSLNHPHSHTHARCAVPDNLQLWPDHTQLQSDQT